MEDLFCRRRALRAAILLPSLLASCVAGCNSFEKRDSTAKAPANQRRAEQPGTSVASRPGDAPRIKVWSRETKIPTQWAWTTTIPAGATRPQAIAATLPAAALLRVVPEAAPPVSLASGESMSQSFVIERVGEHAVRNLADLCNAIEETDKSEIARVTVRNENALESPSSQIEVPPRKLEALGHAAGQEAVLVRTAFEGRPAVMIRQDAVNCIVTVRAERQRGLLQVVLAMGVHWGEPVVLPGEVTATCDRVPLRCLSVSESLELLYGDFERRSKTNAPELTSFAAVSQRDDYLLATNYERLQKRIDEDRSGSFANRVRPALIELPGTEFPGSPLLGDARALTSFLLERELLSPTQPVRVGWIMFAGDAVRHAKAIVINVDLGSGNVPLTFHLPQYQ